MRAFDPDHWRRIPLAPGLETWLAPPEYVVIRKLEWSSEGGGERHRDDIRHLVRNRGPGLDLVFGEQQVRQRALEDAWTRVRS